MKRLICWVVLTAWIVVVSRAADVETNRPDLKGVVLSKDGRTVSGASAFIYTAGPKLGIGFL